jgi:hypothetical protein
MAIDAPPRSLPASAGVIVAPPVAPGGLICFLGLLSAISALLGFGLAISQAPSIIENDHRLAPTFAVAHGYRLYYGPDQGPVLSTIYGPITALAYTPALLASTPMAAERLATAVAIVLFFFPMFLLSSQAGGLSNWQTCASVLGLAAALTFLSPSLSASSVLIHADAPALAAGAVACWLSRVTTRLSARRAILAGVFASLAIMSKQNMLPLSIALGLWWLFLSWKYVFAFAAGAAVSMLAVWAVILRLSSSLSAAWFNWFQIPLHQPYDKTLFFPITDSLVRTMLLYLLPIGAMLGVYFQARAKAGWKARFNSLSILFLWAGLWLVPTSVAGRIKAGGAENALSPAIYFFALACLLELAPYLSAASADDSRARLALVALAILLGTYVIFRLPENVYLTLKKSAQTPTEEVYRFSRSHPGQVYFPQFPLAILMAEGRLYDFSWGLSDRRAAGHPVPEAQFLADTPSSTNKMALTPWVPAWERDIYSRCKAGGDTQDSALPGFTVCEFH